MLLTIYLPVQILQLYVNYVYINEILYIQNILLYAMSIFAKKRIFYVVPQSSLTGLGGGLFYHISQKLKSETPT